MIETHFASCLIITSDAHFHPPYLSIVPVRIHSGVWPGLSFFTTDWAVHLRGHDIGDVFTAYNARTLRIGMTISKHFCAFFYRAATCWLSQNKPSNFCISVSMPAIFFAHCFSNRFVTEERLCKKAMGQTVLGEGASRTTDFIFYDICYAQHSEF